MIKNPQIVGTVTNEFQVGITVIGEFNHPIKAFDFKELPEIFSCEDPQLFCQLKTNPSGIDVADAHDVDVCVWQGALTKKFNEKFGRLAAPQDGKV